jgi:putative heme-binding domain-containing protein
LRAEDVFLALITAPSEVQRHATMLSAPFFETSTDIRLVLNEFAIGKPELRIQLALSLGEAPKNLALSNLITVAQYSADDAWTRAAIVSAARAFASELAQEIDDEAGGSASAAGRNQMVRELAATIGAGDDKTAIERMLTTMQGPAALIGLGEGLARRRGKLRDYVLRLPEADKRRVERQFASAGHIATSSSARSDARVQAIQLLSFLEWSESRQPLLNCLEPSQPPDIQQSALRVLGAFNELGVATSVVGRWKQFSPLLRDEAVGVLISRPNWHEPLLAAIESGEIPPGQISIPHRARLLALRDAKLAERAKKVLASFALGSRKETLDKYQPALALEADSSRGQAVYRRECANCHRLAGEGHDVGPSLETVQHRSPREILIHVLDPNREVSPNFLEYSVRLADGRVLTGLIAAETDAGLTLRRAQRQDDTILRSEIDEISASGKSLMPEGVEQKISPQEMADLISYLLRRSNR